MTSTSSTISTFTLDASLTRIYNESDLPFDHTTRHTGTGFLVGNTLRLQGYIPTPPRKKPSRSWVWNQGIGEAITKASSGVEWHLCRICWDKPQSILTLTGTHTTLILRHMDSHGYNKNGTKRASPSRKRQSNGGDIDAMWKRQKNAQDTTFDRTAWQQAFIEYLVADDLSLRQTTSPALHKLLTFRNPIIEPILPDSKSTARQWLKQSYEVSQRLVQRSLANSKSRITLSFDGWKSGNELDLLGVVAHYVDSEYCVKNVLLGLRNTFGSHTAAEQRYHLLAVCRDFKISNRIA